MMWRFDTSPVEIAVRVAILYFALFAMMRVAGKREVGQLTPIDLLGILLLSETVSPALTAGEDSIPGGLLAAAVLLASSVALSRIAWQWPRAERWIDGEARLLVRDGRLLEDAARSERITRSDLDAALRKQGIERLEEVEKAFVETNGEITIVPRRTADAR